MTAWADFIQEGSFRGIRFDFVSTAEEHKNTLDVQQYRGRNGANVRPQQRDPLRITVMAVFIEDDYPAQMWALSDALDDPTPGELVHPIHGTIKAACENHRVQHDAEEADSGTIQITFVEHTETTAFVFQDRPSVAGKASEVRSNAADVVTNANVYAEDTLNTLLETVSYAVAIASTAYVTAYNTAQACVAAANAVSSVADTLEADGDTLSALAIQATTNQALTAVDTQVKALADYTTTAAYDLSRSLLASAATLGELAELFINAKPPLTTFTVEADISLLAWVHSKYGDSSRVNEVLALNTIPDPLLIPAGTSLRAYAF